MGALLRQHLIDPEVCIRCNTCEETCPHGAITHDRRNYAVKYDVCDGCGACLSPCPTGAIESYVETAEPYPLEQQLAWDALPESASPVEPPLAATEAPPPWSAAHPYVGLYTPERPVTATVSGNLLLTPSEDNEIHHLVLELNTHAFPLLEGQSVGVVAPGHDEFGRPHHPRQYSVASPRDGERPRRNNLALTVKRVVKDHQGKPVRGVASNHLCDLKKGDEVKLTGPYGTTFLMPNHRGSRLLMICTGTGAAPFRAMTERRRRRLGLAEGGELLLFFGARSPEELPYFGPLHKLPLDLIHLELVFSRLEGRPREYVQDRMRSQADAVMRFLEDPDGYVYLCGHKMMEAGVRSAFEDICRWNGRDWAALEQSLLASGRLHIETY